MVLPRRRIGPVRYRYEDFPTDLLRELLTYQELVKLFLQLVLQSGGDVEEAMRWMRTCRSAATSIRASTSTRSSRRSSRRT